MTTKNIATTWKHAKYIVSAQTLRRKSTLLLCQCLQPGSKFIPMTFQIDTAATCNTLSEDALHRLMPKMKLTKSPYLLHPYGDAEPLKPLGQIDLLCERDGRYETLTFQVLPRDVMMNKPALLSGSDCETLGLIIIKADEIFSLTTAVTDSTGKRAPTYQASSSHTSQASGSPTANTNSTPKEATGCTLDQPNQDKQHGEPTTPSPLKPIMIPSKRRLAAPGALTKENVLQQYPENFEGLGCLGPPSSL